MVELKNDRQEDVRIHPNNPLENVTIHLNDRQGDFRNKQKYKKFCILHKWLKWPCHSHLQPSCYDIIKVAHFVCDIYCPVEFAFR